MTRGSCSRSGRVVALVRDADDLGAEAEREQQLGGVGDEADDPHALTVGRDARKLERRDERCSADAEIEQRLAEREQWRAWRARTMRSCASAKLADFAAAIAFVDRVAQAAEAANHHPDILLHGWNKVRLTLSTHSQGGLTDADFALAGEIDRLA